jgi:hypothetical protein
VALQHDARRAAGSRDPREAIVRWKANKTSRRALETAEAWLADPSEANREAWEQAWLATGPPELASFVPVPPGILNETVRPTTIEVAVRLASEATVRKAICKALVAWTLA